MNFLQRIGFAFSNLRTGWRATGGPLTALTEYWSQVNGADNPDVTGNNQKAYKVFAWVFAAVNWKAKFAAMVPLKIYRIPKGKTYAEKEEVEYNHPAYQAWRSVNDREPNYTFKQKIVAYRNIATGVFIYKVDGKKVYTGPATEFHVIPPDRIRKIDTDAQGKVTQYRLHDPKAKPIPAKQMVYIPGFNPDGGVTGMSNLEPLNDTLKAEQGAIHFNQVWMKNAGMPGTLFKGDLPKKQKEVFLRTWDKWHQGKGNRSAMMPSGVEMLIQQAGHKDLEWPELRKMNREEIFGVLGVNSAAMGLDVADRSRHVEARKGVAEDTMVPELTEISQYWNEFCLSEYKDETLVCEWDWSKVPALKEDEDKKTERAKNAQGILTVDEIRARYYGEKPLKNGAGNVVLVPISMVPLGGPDTVDPDRSRKRGEAPVYTDWQRERLAVYRRRLTSLEKQASGWFDDMFVKQKAAVLKAFKRGGGSGNTRDLDDVMAELDEILSVESAAACNKALLASITEGIEHGLEGLGSLDFTFDLEQSPELMKWLKQHTATARTLIDSTTKEQLAALRKTIPDMVAEGATNADIEKALDGVFEGRRHNVKTIARTEVQQGVQHGQQETWRESGMVDSKVWLSSFHSEGRHNDIHEQEVSLDGSFTLPSGISSDGPGMSGDPADDINCLCDMAPKVNLKMAVDTSMKRLEDKLWPESAAGRGSKEWRKSKKLRELTEAS